MTKADEKEGGTAVPPSSGITLAHSSYQPSKAEKEEPLEFPEGTTPEDLARALMRPVRVRYVNPQDRW